MNNLIGIDDESRVELESKKQQATHQYQIVMQAHVKVPHKLAERRNSINRKISLEYKEKRLVAEAFPHGHDSE